MQIHLAKLCNIFFYSLFLFLLLLQFLANFSVFNVSYSTYLPIIFSVIALPHLLPNTKISRNFSKFKKRHTLLILIFGFLIAIPILHLIFFENKTDGVGRSSHEYLFITSILAFCWIIIGITIGRISYLNTKSIIITIFFFIINLIYFLKSLDGGFLVNYYYLSSLRSDGIHIHHLVLTQPLTYLVFIIIAIAIKSRTLKWPLLLLSVYIFFALGGRVAFFSFIASVLIYELFSSNMRKSLINILLIIVILSTLYISLSSNFLSTSNDEFALNKLTFDKGISNDPSYQARVAFLQDLISGLPSQFPIGYLNFFIDKHNNLGTYSHNILSVLQFYGIFAFFIVIYTYYYILKKIIQLKLIHSNNPLNIFGIVILIYTLISILIGKSVSFATMWFVIGFWLSRLHLITMKE